MTPLVLQGAGARTVPGNVTAPIMESAIMVRTLSASCHVKELFLAMTSHYNLCLPLTPLWSLRPPAERKFSILMTELCSAQCRASVSVLQGSRASTVRRFARRTSSVSGAPTLVTATLSTARDVTTSRASVSVARAGEVSTEGQERGSRLIICLQE